LGIAFTIGPFNIAWYGIFIALAVLAAAWVAILETKRKGESVDHLLNMLLLILPLGMIGARLYHVIDQWDYYMQNPGLIVGGQGLGIYGAVIGGAIGMVIYTRWKKLNTIRWFDIAAPGVILAQAIGRWGNYFNQELYGYPTNAPWGVYIDPAHRLPGYESFTHFQPLFLFESILNLIGFGLLMWIGRKYVKRLLDGELFMIYVVYYSIVRFALEGLKIDVWKLWGFPTARWIAIIAVLAVVVITVVRRMRLARSKENGNKELA
jgi:phosphatidylglycerol---prolipoprotein diacylglyceryl transferase